MPSGITIIKTRTLTVVVEPALEACLKEFDPKLDLKEIEPPKLVASVEWAVPAVVAMFFFKPYFDKVMGELGSATGKLLLAAIVKQFATSKRSNGRLLSLVDLETLNSMNVSSNDLNDDDYIEATQHIGRRIAPLEFYVRDSLWCHDFWGERFVNYRFILPAELSDREVSAAIMELSTSYVQFMDELPLEYPELLQMALRNDLQSLPSRVEMVFDKDVGAWTSLKKIHAAKRGNQGKD